MHTALCELDGLPTTLPLTASEITANGLSDGNKQCVEALDLFCAFLGSVAGNLALALGARGGVNIGSGIVPRLGQAFERSRFRDCLEDKGRFRGYLEPIPVFDIDSGVPPALAGAARAL